MRSVAFSLGMALVACHPSPRPGESHDVVVLVSANSEWRALAHVVHGPAGTTPVGETLESGGLLYLHGGWGKIDAAASAQYAIDRWRPRLLVNLGTCGGFAGAVKPDDVVLVDRAVVYDIIERMGDPKEAIDAYATAIDLAWLKPLAGTVRGTIVSADQDLDPARLGELAAAYRAVAADWESGSIARVAAKNHTHVLILRGVSDVVSASGDATYGKIENFDAAAQHVMARLVAMLQSSLASQPLPPRSIE